MKSNYKYLIIIILCLLLTVNLMPLIVAEDQASTLEIQPNKFAIEKGEAFSVDLYVKLNKEADAVGVDHIEWDPTLASFDSAIAGNLFREQTIWIGGKDINNTQGTIDYFVWGSQTPSSGEGTFVRLQFTALKSGTFSIYIPSDKLTIARDGVAIPSTIIGENSPIQQSQEKTFLSIPMPNINQNQTYMIIACITIILFIVSIAVIYSTKKKNLVKNVVEKEKLEN